MKKLLLDSSVVIDFLRQPSKKETLLATLVKDGYQLCISIITHAELYAGKSVWENASARQELQVLFSGMKILPLETEISQKAGGIKAKYGINLLDAIIAATSVVHDLQLATRNVRDFNKIKGIRLFAAI